MSATEEKLNVIAGIMAEHLRWTRLAGMEQLRTIFEKNLSSDEERKVYELSDGEKSVRDIEKITNVGRTKIAMLWKKWHNMGIMEKSEKYEGRRMKRSFSLADVGIQVNIPGNNENTEEFE
ncbi:hypothetical protein [Nitrosarchaeum sp. AC2]|uniref:hypothetical protein n=1 Tax=Nitrosarchaeum sp. AC2 TaxID=2259673 RepID=UPI0015CD8550|nr:hypothetical protein [Nitrosarchaeum sp. AC2]QLH11268.1 hypothetical protein DSQ20_07190 [Nitrosarchaeum sp. AC2]